LLIGAALALVAGPVASASAAIVISEPKAGATVGEKPTFAGTTESPLAVSVVIHEGSESGPEVETVVSPLPSGLEGNWSVSAAHALPSGEYTAVAEQLLEAPASVTFHVDASPPEVTLNSIKTSGNMTPTFSGTASAKTEVVVHIFLKGKQVSEAHAAGTGGAWTSTKASPPLLNEKHTYTAVATQESPLGNPEGESNTITFDVNTNSPKVTMESVPTPSNDATPTFKGTAEPGEVIVHVYEGSKAEGKEAATLKATPSSGKWSVTPGKALEDGVYTAIAEEPSAIENPPGLSSPSTFEIDTQSPTVTLTGPKSPSNNTKPSFSGTATDTEPVTVKIYKGAVASGTPVATLSGATVSEGKWGPVSPSTALEEGEYTAQAEEKSSLGNAPGKSPAATFEIDLQSPTVTLTGPKTPSNNTKPTFSGSATDTEPVTVKVFKGPEASGSPVATGSGPVSSGKWGPVSLSKALESGEYTAQAEEKSSLGNPVGKSAAVKFVVDTTSPKVELTAPASPSNDRTPAFTGSATAETEVVIHIFEGEKEVSKAHAPGTGGAFTSSAASPELPTGKHTFTAVATQASPVGNPAGESNEVSFVVDTTSPKVELTGPKTPSNNTKPTFSGSATDTEPVTVKVFKGSEASGSPVATGSGPVSSGKWGPVSLSKALESGEYTAQAEEKSSLGNPVGKSAAVKFVVDTTSPTVTLNTPETPSKDRTPSFTGTATAKTEVVIHIFEGETEVSKAHAEGTGTSWFSSEASPALATGEHTYTAIATQESPVGNPEGESKKVTFVVDTNPPTVTLTTPKTPSNNRTPTFSGTASAKTQVVVHIYEGTEAKGTEISKATAEGNEGAWLSSAASPALPAGKHTFTAVATQESPLGNPEGKSPTVTFVVNTEPPAVTLNAVPTPSNNKTPSFSGTATGKEPVTVKIFKGSEAKGSPVAIVEATVTSEKWGPEHSNTLLVDSEYTAVAGEVSALGNGEGKSAPVKFVVDTQPPSVTLEALPARSNENEPTFKGTADEPGQVTVHVFEGPKAEGKEAATLKATVSGEGKWSVATPTSLADGVYTAIAKEPSTIGNAEGESSTSTFEVFTKAPTVTLEALQPRSKESKPTFKGTASEPGQVTVHVYEGLKAEGKEAATLKATVSGEGKWSVAPGTALADGNYTALATEPSTIGNPEGKSSASSFEVFTKAPVVTLEALPARSKERKPTFKGTASEPGQVTVHVYEGTKPEGEEAATLKATVAQGGWSVAMPTPLPDGTYTAVATEPSALGNESGASTPSTFEIVTKAPVVTLVAPPARSKETKPTFKGTASEPGTVTVHVFEGPSAEGTEATTLKATVSPEGKWSVAPTTELPDGTYTAKATEPSAIGNEPGSSEPHTFEIFTQAPTVTLEALPPRSNQNKPTFQGFASEAGQVTVHVYEGAKAEGKEAATLKATVSAGKWTVTPPTALLDGKYTALATEPSAIGNEPGASEAHTFEVFTKPPTVTMEALPARTKQNKPTFKGTASEAGTVTVHVYEGAKAEGKEAATLTATVSEGKWSVAPASTLADGTYTAVATEPSAIGNEGGTSASTTFEVVTKPPAVTLDALPARSNESKPTYKGTAGEPGQVTVHVFEGPAPEGKEAATLKATVSEGKWSVAQPVALVDGTYTAIATELSAVGNEAGTSAPSTFEIFTKAPTVTLVALPTRSKQNKPTFEGTASEQGTVTVHVYEGSKAEGKEAATLKAAVSGEGKWSIAPMAALLDGKYTALATEPSAIGNPEGKSASSTFEVFTKAPTVTMVAITPTRSKQSKPTFEGTASEPGQVTVHVFEGSSAEGTEAVTLKATVSPEGKWSIAPAGALPDGTYTALATEPSTIGNAEGESAPSTFEVATAAPTVTLVALSTRSNQNKPTFEGTASEPGTVTVHVFEGSKPEGKQAATLKATVNGEGKWSVAPTTALVDGTYTAQAGEPSAIGNAEGKSASSTFEIFTKPPTVTMAAITPARSNQNKPTFEGTASEPGTVTVRVFEGSKPEGKQAATLKATVNGEGKWSVAPAVALVDGTYTAQAGEPSAIGNAEGKSASSTFEVFTKPPTVTMAPITPTRSKQSKPTFEGTASEPGSVTVHVYEGSKPEGKEAASLKATVNGEGKWSVAPAVALVDGTYTAQASEPSAIGNAEGKSASSTFEIFSKPPTVTMVPLPARSNKNKPTFEGTASEAGTVTVRLFEGTKAEGKEVTQFKATVNGEGKWSVAPATALPDGTYTAQASEPSAIGNEAGASASSTFEIFTKPPTVTLDPLEKLSNDKTPTFSGTASEPGQVTVHVYEGFKAEGKEATTLKATVVGETWSVTSGALSDGNYTAIATEPSAIGNEAGTSAEQHFEINTKPPILKCNSPALKSSESTPAFSGSSSQLGTVTVRVYKGSKSPANEVATLTAEVLASGEWKTKKVSPELVNGIYIEVASEPSVIGNAPGSCESPPFEVNGEVPRVTLNQVAPSNKREPTFSGTSNESTEVTVDVYEGTRAEGVIVSVAKAKVSGGTWTTTPTAPPLKEGKHIFTAKARQPSGLGNGEGESGEMEFEVNTLPPTVTVNPPTSESNVTKPAFSGSASDPKGPVSVRVYAGAKAEGTPVATVEKVSVSEKKWTSEALKTPLKDGEYSVVASEPSSLGNPEGHSETQTFKINTKAPVVTIDEVPSPTSDVTPTFSGRASDPKEVVTVHVYSGANTEGAEVDSSQAEVIEGAWTSPVLEVPLEDGEYTAVATQPSSLKNPTGKSEAITFTVEVQPPTVSEISSSANRSSALMNASIDANGGRLSICRFEYGTTTEYGKEAQCAFDFGGHECAFVFPASKPECEFPTDKGVASYVRVFRLAPSTTYYFRVTTENDGGKGNVGIGEGQFRTADREEGSTTPTEPNKTPGTTPTTPSDAVLAEMIIKQLAPGGKGATIGNLLKHHEYKASFKAPTAGTAVIGWYYLPPGASLSKKSKHGAKALLVAWGKRAFTSAGSGPIALQLTPAGRRLLRADLLKGVKKLKLTAKCVFTPTGKNAITTLKVFSLKS
jgi:hypothetical protein